MKTPYEKCPILRNSTALSFDSIESAKHEIRFQEGDIEARKKSNPIEESEVDRLEEEKMKCLQKNAIYVSIISFIVSLILSLAGLICTIIRSSPSTAAFSADCFLDALASIIVFLKYWKSLRGQVLKEATACIYLGSLFVTSALAVIIKATTDIATQPEVEESTNIVGLTYLSVASAVSFIALAGAKYWLYKKLNDDSLILDAINTLFSGIFAIAIGITAQVMLNYPHLWYLDAAESMIFAAFLGAYGIKVIGENIGHHKRDQLFKNLDSEEDSEEYSGKCAQGSSESVHEKKKLIDVVSGTNNYTTFNPNNRDLVQICP